LGQRLANFSCGIVALLLGLINASGPACSEPAIALDPDGFTNTVAQALNALAIPAPARVVSPLTLTARDSTGTEIQINLDRIYSACKSDQQRCPDFISNLITGAADALQARRVPPTPATLRAVVRPEAYLRSNPQLAQLAIRVAHRELPEGLVALIYVDKARAMGTVSARELVEMHLSTDDAYRLGLRNLAADLRPIDQAIKALSPRGIGTLRDSPYESSRLLLHADWAKVSKKFGGHLIVATPSAEELLYADGSTAEAIDALSALARDRFAKAERGISPSVFEWQPERWVVVAH
jgi:hypothetical protein